MTAPKATAKKTPAVEEAPAESPDGAQEAPICGDCWPVGWPDLAETAGCVHGEWSRTDAS